MVNDDAVPMHNGLTAMQSRKLRQRLSDAVSYVPLYRHLYADLLGSGTDVSNLERFSDLPLLCKRDLAGASPGDRLDSRYLRRHLYRESTTGSTGMPLSIRIDREYRARRNLRFLRALMSCGYRPWRRLLLLTDRVDKSTRKSGSRHYEPVLQPTDALLRAYRRIRPGIVYGFTTPLRLLAERIRRDCAQYHRPDCVITTAEMLDPGTRKTLSTVFECPVYDFYGMTEMGLVAWQQPGQSDYRVADGSILTEFLPDDTDTGVYRVVLTNLDLRASPVIRYDTGDLATVEWIDGRPRITAFEGRSIDALVDRDGRELSPYRVTDALLAVPNLRRFRVSQRTLTGFLVEIDVDRHSRDNVERAVSGILTALLNAELEIEFRDAERLLPEGARKFRPVESLVRQT